MGLLLELRGVAKGLWEAFQAAGAALPEHRVVARWERVRGLGVSPAGTRESRELLGPGELASHRDAADELVFAASEVLPSRVGDFSRRDFRVLLTDAEGVVLGAHAGGAFTPTARRMHLMEGGRWAEAVRGTNAIGTSVAEGRPVVVEGAAHYLRENHDLVCYASPIYDAYGDLRGVLDATSLTAAARREVRQALLDAAEAIQGVLRREAFARSGPGLLQGMRATLSRCPTPAYMIGWPGTVLASNDAACVLIRRPAEGLSSGDALGVHWDALLAAILGGQGTLDVPPLRGAGAGQRLTLEPLADRGGRVLAALVFAEPSRITAPRSVRVRRPAPALVTPAAVPGAHFGHLLGSDPKLVQTKRLAARIAKSRLPVLVLAETGTGKGLLARAIHEASGRRGQLVDVNCGAIPASLLESELFGYAEGAFTGARRGGREGVVHRADGGTLFLDEVAEMSPALQAALLRVLEDGTYNRVGDARPCHADVRLICATSRELGAMVGSGEFRSDLYYRIRGATVTLPPLRERTDLLELAEGILGQLTDEAGAARLRLDDEVRSVLLAHDWPGNVRELRMTLHFASVLAADSGFITRDDLPAELLEADAAAAHGGPATGDGTGSLLADVERDAVTEALRASSGNLTRAATLLGVARSTLYRMLRRHGLRGGG